MNAPDVPIAGRRRWRSVVLVIVCWAGANLIALWLIDMYDAYRLGREHGVSSTVIRQFERRIVSVTDPSSEERISLAYRVRMPFWWAGRHSMPLLVMLHGSGQRGYDGVRQLKGAPTEFAVQSWADAYPCAVLVPQCPEQMSWSSPITSDLGMQDVLLQMIDDLLEDRRLDPRRVYLCGFSMGGFGTWNLAAHAPERFAAVVPVAGGASQELADQLKDVPIWAVHSADDETVSVDGTRQIIEALREVGGNPHYTELTDAGHSSWPEAFREDSAILNWMFDQRLPER